MPQKSIRRVKLASLIVVGEGLHEEAFLGHLKDLFDHRESNQTVKIESGDGGSPYDVLRYVARKKHVAYDRQYVLLDSDVGIKPTDRVFAKNNNIENN